MYLSFQKKNEKKYGISHFQLEEEVVSLSLTNGALPPAAPLNSQSKRLIFGSNCFIECNTLLQFITLCYSNTV